MPPGSVLPSGAECAARVKPRPENRQQNFIANHYTPPYAPVGIAGAENTAFNTAFAGRIDGNFQGTTDEIIQWAACKWGMDEETRRAVAARETGNWAQATSGDFGTDRCNLIGMAAPCWTSYGLYQVRGTYHPGTYPRAQQSTAWNADYAGAHSRACFEGAMAWLNYYNPPTPYAAGDEIGCTGMWFSGRWYDSTGGGGGGGAIHYIGTPTQHWSVLWLLANKPWLRSGF